MGMFDLFRTEALSGKRIRNSYIMNILPLECCKKIMSITELTHNKIRLTLEGEEMRPDRRVSISSFAELLRFTEEADASLCLFKCLYKGRSVDIVVDFGLKMLNIASEDSEVIESIKNILEG